MTGMQTSVRNFLILERNENLKTEAKKLLRKLAKTEDKRN